MMINENQRLLRPLRESPVPSSELNHESIVAVLSEELLNQFGGSGAISIGNNDISTPDGVRINWNDSGAMTWLEFVRVEEGFLPVVVGYTAEAVMADISKWSVALETTLARIALGAPLVAWNGIIGPLRDRQFLKSWRLTENVVTSGFSLQSADVYMQENATGSSPWAMDYMSSQGSWPIVISGQIEVFESFRSLDPALKTMTKAAALMSLALSEPWGPRAHPFKLTEHQYCVPGKPQGTSEWIPSPDVPPGVPIELTDWLPAAWEKLELPENTALTQAVWLFREGLMLLGEHSSFALVAFTSALEAIAAKKFKARRCPECNQVTQATQRFRQLLIEHLGQERAEWYIEFYKKRSKTVHQGLLYGKEVMSGWGSTFDPFAKKEDSLAFFDGDLEYNFGRTTREIILKEMGLPFECINPWALEAV